jgi:tetrahydromethanopterin S-methyltransferase subunit B
MTYLKIKDNQTLVRDVDTKCIVNTDFEGYSQYIENYKSVYTEKQKINQMERQMDDIKNDISEIKTILRNLTKT